MRNPDDRLRELERAFMAGDASVAEALAAELYRRDRLTVQWAARLDKAAVGVLVQNDPGTVESLAFALTGSIPGDRGATGRMLSLMSTHWFPAHDGTQACPNGHRIGDEMPDSRRSPFTPDYVRRVSWTELTLEVALRVVHGHTPDGLLEIEGHYDEHVETGLTPDVFLACNACHPVSVWGVRSEDRNLIEYV